MRNIFSPSAIVFLIHEQRNLVALYDRSHRTTMRKIEMSEAHKIHPSPGNRNRTQYNGQQAKDQSTAILNVTAEILTPKQYGRERTGILSENEWRSIEEACLGDSTLGTVAETRV